MKSLLLAVVLIWVETFCKGHAFIKTLIVFSTARSNDRLLWLGWMLFVGLEKGFCAVFFDRAVVLDKVENGEPPTTRGTAMVMLC